MAASAEAVTALLESVEAWDAYRKEAWDRIDLTVADLSNRNLSNRAFVNCDLSGSDLDYSTLDNCHFEQVLIDNVSMRHASLVASTFTSVNIRNTTLDHSVIRSSKFERAHIAGSGLKHVRVSDSKLFECELENVEMHSAHFAFVTFRSGSIRSAQAPGIELVECRLPGITLSDNQWPNGLLAGCDLSDSTVDDLHLTDGSFHDSVMRTSRITRLDLNGTAVNQIDLTGSTLREIDLASIALPNSILLGAAIVNCRWPSQRGHVSATGVYTKSLYLLGQPVQDIRGVPPRLRREIADAQYLDDLHNSKLNLLSRLLLRIWGASTAFGQSMMRLTIVTAIVVVLLTLAFVVDEGSVSIRSGLSENSSALADAFSSIASAFFGAGSSITTSGSANQHTSGVLLFARVIGFVFLGLWITVAAEKLVKLSAE